MSEYEAVRKLQSRFRTTQGKKYLQSLFLERLQRVFSIRHNRFFYYNTVNHAKSWSRPTLFRPLDLDCPIRDPDDLPWIQPPLTRDDAAAVIQAMVRSYQSRRFLRHMLASRYETCTDSKSGRLYYRDRRTHAVRWEKPFGTTTEHVSVLERQARKASSKRKRHMTEIDASIVLQRYCRGALARQHVQRIVERQFRAYVDQTSGQTYYYNCATKDVTWIKPRLYRDDPVVTDRDHARYQCHRTHRDNRERRMTRDQAASMVQRVVRGQQCRRALASVIAARFETVWSVDAHAFYVIDRETKATRWLPTTSRTWIHTMIHQSSSSSSSSLSPPTTTYTATTDAATTVSCASTKRKMKIMRQRRKRKLLRPDDAATMVQKIFRARQTRRRAAVALSVRPQENVSKDIMRHERPLPVWNDRRVDSHV
jgi:hypothetical protein